MTPQDICQRLKVRFGPAITQSLPDDKHPRVHIQAQDLPGVAEFLLLSADLGFDWLACVTGVDYVSENKMACVYDLYSTRHGHWFAVKAYTDRAKPVVPSVMKLWPAADWHEREIYDLLGIDFPGHTDLRRILLPEDWKGHPLRKDYVFPREYHGIPGSYELDWQQKPDYPK
jgi:NADH-quinone oxidoreductase subunit C